MPKVFCILLLVTAPFLVGLGQSARPVIVFSSAGYVSSVQMNGSAAWHYGSDEETGNVTLTAFANGQTRMDLQLSGGGSRVETQSPFADAARICTWAGSDGVVHNVADHNCWLSTVWFLPQITMQLGAGAPDDIASSVASADGKTLRLHHERHPLGTHKSQTGKLLARVSAVDLEVDAATGLAQSLLFNVHPDKDAVTDIPTEIQFSDYHTVEGVAIPFHIRKLINHSLVLDLEISEARVRFGASTAGSATSAAQ